MGSSYCLSADKKTMANETINIQVCEEVIEEKNNLDPPTTNLDLINKNLITNDTHSNNTGINRLNQTDLSNIIIVNNIQKITKTNHKNKTDIIPQSKLKSRHSNNKNNPETIDKKEKGDKKQTMITNDILVSGNEISPEKIYLKKELLGSGAFGEVWLVHHNDLDRDFAMKIIKKRKNKSSDEKEILNEINILKKLDHPKILN